MTLCDAEMIIVEQKVDRAVYSYFDVHFEEILQVYVSKGKSLIWEITQLCFEWYYFGLLKLLVIYIAYKIFLHNEKLNENVIILMVENVVYYC